MSNTPTFTDEAAQAFVEDLASVFAKHGLQITSWEAISAEPLDPDSKIVAINKDGDIRFLTEPPQPPKLRPLKWYEDPSVPRQLPEPEFRAFAPIPVNAHGRLAAAARVDAIRNELTPPAATAHIECGWCCAEDLEIECCPSCGKGGYVAAAIKTPKPKEANHG